VKIKENMTIAWALRTASAVLGGGGGMMCCDLRFVACGWGVLRV
jgi:hypothetical protein